MDASLDAIAFAFAALFTFGLGTLRANSMAFSLDDFSSVPFTSAPFLRRGPADDRRPFPPFPPGPLARPLPLARPPPAAPASAPIAPFVPFVPFAAPLPTLPLYLLF